MAPPLPLRNGASPPAKGVGDHLYLSGRVHRCHVKQHRGQETAPFMPHKFGCRHAYPVHLAPCHTLCGSLMCPRFLYLDKDDRIAIAENQDNFATTPSLEPCRLDAATLA
jgi:hypothetical protein|tara:strand:- start:1706 stop:2035 length:330 start_codon:yes stop_codon:yes gene_type:complete